MFGCGEPPRWAIALPGYGPSRVIVDGAFSGTFHAANELTLGIAWVLILGATVAVALSRLVAVQDRANRHAIGSPTRTV